MLKGAPFIICSSCFKLVQVPADFAVSTKTVRKLRCGSCSAVLSYSYRDPDRKKHGDQYSADGSPAAPRGHGRRGDKFAFLDDFGHVDVSYSTEDEQPLHVSRNSSFDTVDDERSAKLHRLMGYSSASELLRLRRSPDLYESFGERTPAARTSDTKGKAICVADEEEHPSAKVRRGRGLPLPGILKKGIHGLESLKLR